MRDISCDPILIHELVEPGSDLRWGVNVLCRPESPLADIIVSVQNRLRELEPGQYYYPVQDLHLTVSEICHSMKPAEARKIAINVEKCTDALFTDLAAFELHSPAIVFDAHGCALNFTSGDRKLASIRQSIRARIAALGIACESRAKGSSAHITFMRYIGPLSRPVGEWLSCLRNLPQPECSWMVSELWLTWGATWFGMRSRITERGPYHLLRSLQQP